MSNKKDRELQSKLAEASKGIEQLNESLAKYRDADNLAVLRDCLIDRRRKVIAEIGKNDARSCTSPE